MCPEVTRYSVLPCEAALDLLSSASLSACALGLAALHVAVEEESVLYVRPSPTLTGLVRGTASLAAAAAEAEAGTLPGT